MTERTTRTPYMCCVRDCGTIAGFHLDATLPAITDPHGERPRLEIRLGLVVCQAHRDNPVHTCVEFFGPAQREWLDRVCKEQGKDLPDYTRAAWAFPQVLVPQSEVN